MSFGLPWPEMGSLGLRPRLPISGQGRHSTQLNSLSLVIRRRANMSPIFYTHTYIYICIYIYTRGYGHYLPFCNTIFKLNHYKVGFLPFFFPSPLLPSAMPVKFSNFLDPKYLSQINSDFHEIFRETFCTCPMMFKTKKQIYKQKTN